MDFVLVIHESPELAKVIASILWLGLKLDSTRVYNLQDARKALKKSGTAACKLIVSSLSAPISADVSTPVDRSYPTTLDFLAEIRDGEDVPAAVLVPSIVDTARADRLLLLKNVELLAAESLPPSLCPVAAKLLGLDNAPKARPSPLDLDILLPTSAGAGSLGRWHLRSTVRKIDRSGLIRISSERLNELILDSNLLGAARNDDTSEVLPELLRRLGTHMYNCVLGDYINTEGLGEQLFHLTEALASLGDTRLRFEVNATTAALFVETLARPSTNTVDTEDLWMLRLPIFRKFVGRGGRAPLFKDESSRIRPVHCLVIEGQTTGFNAGGHIGKFPPLPAAEKEILWLEDYLNRGQATFGLAPPKFLHARDFGKGKFLEAVVETLSSQPWQLIHYSGHSEIGSDGKAYLVLGPDKEDLLDIELLARLSPYAQFVFLNSCNSANSKFVVRLAEHNVPAVAGYAWPIPDLVAARFSRMFYESLFRADRPEPKGFLEYAFMDAKKGLYKDYQGKSLWVAPLLFMQTLASEAGARSAGRQGVIS